MNFELLLDFVVSEIWLDDCADLVAGAFYMHAAYELSPLKLNDL